MHSKQCLPIRRIIDFPVVALPFNDQVALILEWARNNYSKIVCLANVHMLMEGHQNPNFAPILQQADLVTPDGMPLVWMLRLMGVSRQERVAGIDVLLAVCQYAAAQNISIFFLGSQSAILERMRTRLEQEFPTLTIAGMEPLPFRPVTQLEDEEIIQQLNNSGAGVVFVSLGCPKQEIWMAQHKGKVQAVMIGLGAAFPVYAGVYTRAPQFIRDLGLEWLYRLIQEPRRLWKRYSRTIPVFLWLACKQLLTLHHPVKSQEM